MQMSEAGTELEQWRRVCLSSMGHGLAVREQFDIAVAAASGEPKLLGPTQEDLSRAGELNFLQLRCHNFDVAIERRRQALHAEDIVRHGVMILPASCVLALCTARAECGSAKK